MTARGAVIFGSIALGATSIVFALWPPPVMFRPPSVSPIVRRLAIMKQFSEALFAYRLGHGSFPDKLSALVPTFVPESKIHLFYPRLTTRESWSTIPSPLRMTRNLDDCCGYIYFRENATVDLNIGRARVILMERFRFDEGEKQVACIFADGSGAIVNISDLNGTGR